MLRTILRASDLLCVIGAREVQHTEPRSRCESSIAGVARCDQERPFVVVVVISAQVGLGYVPNIAMLGVTAVRLSFVRESISKQLEAKECAPLARRQIKQIKMK